MASKKHPAPKHPTPMPQMARRALSALIIIAFILLAGEFIIHRHAYSDLEATRFFYALYGFGAFLIVVIGGVLLRFLVMRAPDYYQRAEKDDG